LGGVRAQARGRAHGGSLRALGGRTEAHEW
jgi:hypothetical protein